MRSPWTSYTEPSCTEPSYIGPSYIEPSYIEPSYMEPSYIKPSYIEPSYIEPSYIELNYIEPSYIEPSYIEPSYIEPSYTEPSYIAPSYIAPSYIAPSYIEPSYIEPSYIEPSYIEPSYIEPSYIEPSYIEPSYIEPSYIEPSYIEPSCIEPSGAEPSDTEPGGTEPRALAYQEPELPSTTSGTTLTNQAGWSKVQISTTARPLTAAEARAIRARGSTPAPTFQIFSHLTIVELPGQAGWRVGPARRQRGLTRRMAFEALNRRAGAIPPQLWLGAVLARAQPCDGAGPAVELPGLGHIVDAHQEGQTACEERVSEL